MLISRATTMCRLLMSRKTLKMKNIRNMSGHAYIYRAGAPPPVGYLVKVSEFMSSFMWWWVLWHLFHEHEHITGEFPYPDARKWTDHELGIPRNESYPVCY